MAAATNKSAAKTTDKPKSKSGPALMVEVLEAAGRPVRTSLIVGRVLANPDMPYKGGTPGATMTAQLATSHKRGGQFVRTEPGVYAIRAWPKPKLDKKAEGVKAAKATASTGESREAVAA